MEENPDQIRPFEKRLSELYFKNKNKYKHYVIMVERSARYFNDEGDQEVMKKVAIQIVKSFENENIKFRLRYIRKDKISSPFSIDLTCNTLVAQLKNLSFKDDIPPEISLSYVIEDEVKDNSLVILVTSGELTDEEFEKTHEIIKPNVDYLVVNLLKYSHLYCSLFGYDNVFYIDSNNFKENDLFLIPESRLINIYPNIENVDYTTRSIKFDITVDPLLKTQEYDLQILSDSKKINEVITVCNKRHYKADGFKPGSRILIRLKSKQYSDIMVELIVDLFLDLFYSPFYNHSDKYEDDQFVKEAYMNVKRSIIEHEHANKMDNFNIVLVGELGSGKTTLLNALHSAFIGKEEIRGISHVSNESITRQLKAYKLNETTIKIWDLFGYKVNIDYYLKILPSLLSGGLKEGYSEWKEGNIEKEDRRNNDNNLSSAAHGVFIVFSFVNIKSEYHVEGLKEILKEISKQPKESRVIPIILLTKAQLHEEINSKEIQDNPLLLYEKKVIRDEIKWFSEEIGYEQTMIFPILSVGDKDHKLTYKHYYTILYPLLYLLNTCSNLRLTDLCEVLEIDELETKPSPLSRKQEIEELERELEEYNNRIRTLQDEIEVLNVYKQELFRENTIDHYD